MNILVVDGSKTQVVFLESSLHSLGHRTRAALNAGEALQQVEIELPDLVLLDVGLPDRAAADLIAPIRERAKGRFVPVVVMSPVEASEEAVAALDRGADDVLMKPIHLGMLNAKIRSTQKVSRTNAKLSETAQLLERYRDGAEGELQLARNLIQHMIKRDGLKDPVLEWYVLPSAKFSGDLVASTRTDDGNLYVLFADASGHGLAAAISGLPALQVFYAMAKKNVSVGEIAREMNNKLKEYLPLGRYLATQLMHVDFARREVDIWNGGMPAGVVLVDGAAQPNSMMESRHLPLGVAPKDLFDPTAVRFPWTQSTRLVLVSDGLIEAANAAGEAFGPQRLVRVASRAAGTGVVAPILQALRIHMMGIPPHDDVSILSLTLP